MTTLSALLAGSRQCTSRPFAGVLGCRNPDRVCGVRSLQTLAMYLSTSHLSIADGHAERIAASSRPATSFSFLGTGVPRPVPLVGRGPWVGCGQLFVSVFRSESGSFEYMVGEWGFANVLFSGWRGCVSVVQLARFEVCDM